MSLAARYSDLALSALGGEGEYGAVDDLATHVAVARGDTRLDEDDDGEARSPLVDVADPLWTQFMRSLATAGLSDVSDSNGVGMFEMMPRRLADLGVVTRLGRGKSDAGRTIWVAVFVPPMTAERFLRSPRAQEDAFCRSMVDYDERLRSGQIAGDPAMSRSGKLAILHRAGPRGLDTWRDGERFEATRRAYERVAGIF